jgi:hypothetical protein
MTDVEPDANSYPIINNRTRAEAAITAAKFLNRKSPKEATFLVKNLGFFWSVTVNPTLTCR